VFLWVALRAISDQWRSGDRATAVVIAMLPAWLFLALAVLLVGGGIEVALGIPGSSGPGTLIGVITLVAAGAILFGGPIWSLRRLAKVLRDRGDTVGEPRDAVRADHYVRVRGINLGEPDNVVGCATFLIFVAALLACWALLTVVAAAYEAVGKTSPEVVRGIEDVGFWLGLGFTFVFTLVVTLWARARVRRWILRRGVE